MGDVGVWRVGSSPRRPTPVVSCSCFTSDDVLIMKERRSFRVSLVLIYPHQLKHTQIISKMMRMRSCRILKSIRLFLEILEVANMPKKNDRTKDLVDYRLRKGRKV